MSIAAPHDTRIDSRFTTFLLVAVLSFALGVSISLFVAGQPQPVAPSTPCPTHCPKLILMSTRAPALGERCEEPFEGPAAFAPASVNAAP
jgi:hypothetical protein